MNFKGLKDLKKYSTSLAMREMQIETSLRFHLTPIRMTKNKNPNDSLCWRGCGVKGTLLHCWWKCKLRQPLWISIWQKIKFQKIRKQSFSRPRNTTFGYIPKEYLIIPQGHVLNYIHSSIICNSQNLENLGYFLGAPQPKNR